MAQYTTVLRGNDLWRLTIQLVEICVILTTSYGCNLVGVKFSIGVVDEDNTYQYNNNFSVVLQYRSKSNDEWITEWSKKIIYNGIAENVELNLTLPSNAPHLQLKWLQNTSSNAPELFINDITIKGILSDDNNNNNGNKRQGMKNCKLDKVIDFNQDGSLSYLLCNSEAKVNKDGLIFGGQTNKQVTLCTFNLASGMCIGSKDTACTSASEVSPTAASSGMISSTTSMMLTVTNIHTTLSTEMPQSTINTVSFSNVITSAIISNSATSFSKIVSSITLPLSATQPISATSSSKLMMSSSIELLSISIEPSSTIEMSSIMSPLDTAEFSSTSLLISTNVVAPFSTELSSMSVSSFSVLVSPSTIFTKPTGMNLSVSKTDTNITSTSVASLSVQSSATSSLFSASMSFNTPSSSTTQIHDKSNSTSLPLLSVMIQISGSVTMSTSILLLSPSSTISHVVSEISVSVLPSNSTKLSTSKSVSAATSTIVSMNVVLSTKRIQPTISVTILDNENCAEESFKNTRRKAQPLHSTRRLFCSNSNSFIKQVCNKSLATDQAVWHPDLPDSCKNGQSISERLYSMVVMNATVNEPIQFLITSMKDSAILSGNAILLSNLLAKLKGCSDNDEEVGALNILLSSQYISAIEQLEERDQLHFVNNIFIAADFYGFNCYNQTFLFKATSVSLIVRTNLMKQLIENDIILSHDDGSSFVLPKSVLTAAQKENHFDFRAVSYRFAGLNTILSRPLAKNDLQYKNGSINQLGSPVVSLSISCTTENCANALEKDGVQITIVHNIQIHQENDTICAFWNYSTSNKYRPFWSTRGCEVMERAVNVTVCKCNHLTHFGILFDATGRSSAKINSENTVALSVTTYVGVSFSLMALILTIISMMLFRSQWDLRTFVHINLCCTLFIAQLIFIVAVDKTSNSAGCASVAILLHYFFITSFMWMLMEGVVLHIMLVNVFSFKHIGRRYYVGFTLLCYGGPLLYMALCIPLGLARTNEWSYGSDNFCWLTYDDNFIWVFIAPVLLILLINIGFLVMSLKIMKRHLSDKRKKPWYWFRGSMSLVVIMGINWIFGILVLHEYLLPLIYLFAITVALQGVWIFLLFTVGSRQMREEYGKLLKSLQSKMLGSNSKMVPRVDVVPKNGRKDSCQKTTDNYEMHEIP